MINKTWYDASKEHAKLASGVRESYLKGAQDFQDAAINKALEFLNKKTSAPLDKKIINIVINELKNLSYEKNVDGSKSGSETNRTTPESY